MKGQFGPNSVETGSQQAAMLLQLDFDGVPLRDVSDVFSHLDALTLEQVNRVVQERFPQKLDWVIVGQAETCRPLAAKFGQVTETKLAEAGWGPR